MTEKFHTNEGDLANSIGGVHLSTKLTSDQEKDPNLERRRTNPQNTKSSVPSTYSQQPSLICVYCRRQIDTGNERYIISGNKCNHFCHLSCFTEDPEAPYFIGECKFCLTDINQRSVMSGVTTSMYPPERKKCLFKVKQLHASSVTGIFNPRFPLYGDEKTQETESYNSVSQDYTSASEVDDRKKRYQSGKSTDAPITTTPLVISGNGFYDESQVKFEYTSSLIQTDQTTPVVAEYLGLDQPSFEIASYITNVNEMVVAAFESILTETVATTKTLETFQYNSMLDSGQMQDPSNRYQQHQTLSPSRIKQISETFDVNEIMDREVINRLAFEALADDPRAILTTLSDEMVATNPWLTSSLETSIKNWCLQQIKAGVHVPVIDLKKAGILPTDLIREGISLMFLVNGQCNYTLENLAFLGLRFNGLVQMGFCLECFRWPGNYTVSKILSLFSNDGITLFDFIFLSNETDMSMKILNFLKCGIVPDDLKVHLKFHYSKIERQLTSDHIEAVQLLGFSLEDQCVMFGLNAKILADRGLLTTTFFSLMQWTKTITLPTIYRLLGISEKDLQDQHIRQFSHKHLGQSDTSRLLDHHTNERIKLLKFKIQNLPFTLETDGIPDLNISLKSPYQKQQPYSQFHQRFSDSQQNPSTQPHKGAPNPYYDQTSKMESYHNSSYQKQKQPLPRTSPYPQEHTYQPTHPRQQDHFSTKEGGYMTSPAFRTNRNSNDPSLLPPRKTPNPQSRSVSDIDEPQTSAIKTGDSFYQQRKTVQQTYASELESLTDSGITKQQRTRDREPPETTPKTQTIQQLGKQNSSARPNIGTDEM